MKAFLAPSALSALLSAFVLATNSNASPHPQVYGAGGGIDPTRTYALPNSGFEAGNLSSWSSYPTPSVWSVSTAFAKEGTYSARAELATPSSGTLWSSIPITNPDPDMALTTSQFFGEKVMYGIWFYLSSVTTHGTVKVQVASYTGTNKVIADRSFDTSAMPVGKWIYLRPLPSRDASQFQGEEGRLVAGTTLVTFALEYSGFQGTFYVDGTRGGRFEYVEYALLNNSFEDIVVLISGRIPASWQKSGAVASSLAASDPFDNPSYYGSRHVIFTSTLSGPPAKEQQVLAITNALGSPKHLDAPRASFWFRCDSGTQGSVSATLSARTPTGQLQQLVSQSYSPTANDFSSKRWIYIETPASATPIPFQIGAEAVTGLQVSIQSTVNGNVWVDYAQAGQLYATNGNPHKYVIADVEMSYRAQDPDDLEQLRLTIFPTLPPGATNDDLDGLDNLSPPGSHYAKGLMFGNWAGFSTAPDPTACYLGVTPPIWPGCDPLGLDFWKHDPSLLDRSTPCDRRQNGRLDVGTSIDNPVSVVGGGVSLVGANDVPLTGAYTNADPAIIRWQISMAKAAGVDAFSLEVLGHAISAEAWYFPHPAYPFGLDTPAAGEFWWAADDTLTPGPVPPDAPPGVVDWYGLDATHAVSPRAELAAEAFWDVAEKTDVKLVPIMVLSAHTNQTSPGWLQLTDMEDQVEAIQYDICRYVQYYYDRKPTLKINGAMLMGIFWQTTALYDVNADPNAVPPETGPSLETRWPEIIAEVNAHLPQGRKVVLLGTWAKPDGNPAAENFLANTLSADFTSLSPWSPLDGGYFGTEPTSFLHKYKTFSDFIAGAPLLHPADNANTGLDWNTKATEAARDLAWRVTQWASVDDSKRLPLGFFYPDFDNSGTAGNVGPLQSATLGGNVCVQVMSENVTDMLGKTFDANVQAGIDWMHLCTWNSWNETTRVEPLWDPEYWSAAQGAGFDPNLDPRTYFSGTQADKDQKYNRIFDRVLRLQEKVAAHKGIGLDPTSFYKISGKYLKDQADGLVTVYR